MSDLKPLGSEKLNGDAKLQRILELTYYGEKKKTSTSHKAELVKESKNGGVYGIVKEKDGYYVKRGLNEGTLDYIGGIFMKNKNRFSSYSEALKRLELLKGQEELYEATKYVLKQKPSLETEVAAPAPTDDVPAPAPAPAPAAPDAAAPAPAPAPDAPAPADDMGGDQPQGGDDDEKSGMRSSYMEEIQKFAGKLGQELRDQHEKLEGDDIKYVLNMIISAVDLDKLSDDDIKEIGKKFERDEEEGALEPSNSGDEESAPAPAPAPEPSAEKDLSEDDAMAALDEFINSPIPEEKLDEVDLDDYTMDDSAVGSDEDTYGDIPKLTSDDLGWEVPADHKHHDMDNEPEHEDDEMMDDESMDQQDETKEIDLDEIKNSISKAIGETLSKHFS